MLPLPDRDSRALLQVVPGAVRDYRGDYAIQGLDGRRNTISLDGTTTKDPFLSLFYAAPPPDTLKEFTVESNYSAEYGGAVGSAVLMTTRSGTNQVHGSVYDYFRSENLDANTFFRNA